MCAGGGEVFTFGKCFACRSAQPFYSFDAQVAEQRLGLLESQVGYFEVLVVEAVLHEVDEVRNDCLGSLRLQQVYQVVVGSRKEFDKNLADHAHARFFDIQDLNVVEIRDDVAAELFEFPAGTDSPRIRTSERR